LIVIAIIKVRNSVGYCGIIAGGYGPGRKFPASARSGLAVAALKMM